jgi:hypothetical protein
LLEIIILVLKSLACPIIALLRTYIHNTFPNGRVTDVDGFAKLNDDGSHQQDGGHVVEKGRNDGSDEAEDGQQRPHAAFRHLWSRLQNVFFFVTDCEAV